MNFTSFEELTKKYIPDISLTNCSHIDVGVHGHVLITQDHRVVKIPTVVRQASQYEHEQAALDYVQQYVSTHIARILHIVAAPKAPGGYILEMEHAKGNELTPNNTKDYSPQELLVLGKDIGNFFSELHTTPLSPNLGTKQLPQTNIAAELALLSQRAYWNKLDEFEQNYVVSIYQRALPYFEHFIPRVIVHNDFGMNHLFVEKSNLSAVIDWDCIKVGDPAQDWRWAVGPRSIHPTCFKEALTTYMNSIKPDSSFLGRVLYYNEVKVVNALVRAELSGDSESFVKARNRLHETMKSIKFLREIVEQYQFLEKRERLRKTFVAAQGDPEMLAMAEEGLEDSRVQFEHETKSA